MKSLWKIARNISAIAGAIMIFGAISTSDYYVIELEQAQPAFVSRNLIIGALLMLPWVLNLIYNAYKENNKNETV
jgi:hypothetical protein